jgi:hypothetical protein
MPYLIDGHNLIPFMHGISLDQLDDELRLIDVLEAYFRKIRKKAIIFFDRGQPGSEPEIKRGFVTARFTRAPLIADQAIRNQLNQSGGASRNYTVVSSDHEVASFAQHKGAKVISSREFASAVHQSGRSRGGEKMNPEDDLDYWLKKFGENS